MAVGIAAIALITGLQAPASASAASEYLWTSGGYGLWQADPASGDPGDSFKACDTTGDGWAISVAINYDGVARQDDTRGHNSGYCTPWNSGDIPEGTSVNILVEQVKSDGHGGLLHGASNRFTRTA
jgi:hypothetical protein